jgi:hypothetical protein
MSMTMHETNQLNDAARGLAEGVEEAPWLGAQWADTARAPQDDPVAAGTSDLPADVSA